MGRFQDIMPYVILGSIMGVFSLYVVLTVHYSANIASSQQRLAYELRKIRKLHSPPPTLERGAGAANRDAGKMGVRSNEVNLLSTPAFKTNQTVNVTS